MPVLDLADVGERAVCFARTGHFAAGERVVDRKRQVGRLEERDRGRRDALHVDRMDPGREVVRVRARGYVHDRVCSEERSGAPAAPLPQAVLAVADELGRFVVGKNDVDVLPVALVRLPDEVAGGIGVRVDVVVVEVPVLEHDRARLAGNASVDDARSGAF